MDDGEEPFSKDAEFDALEDFDVEFNEDEGAEDDGLVAVDVGDVDAEEGMPPIDAEGFLSVEGVLC